MDNLWQDIRFGFRMLWKAPSFSLIAIAALALGIGANTAIFSVVNAVLLRPLPFPESSHLLSVYHSYPNIGLMRASVSPNAFDFYRQHATSFEAFAALSGYRAPVNLTGNGEPQRLRTVMVTGDYFRALAVAPMKGRAIDLNDDQPGKNRVAVLGNGLWRTQFGSDPSIVGKTITLDGNNYDVIGLMPPTFDYPSKTDLWVPMALTPEELKRPAEYMDVIARVKPGVSLQQAQAEMQRLTRAYREEYARFFEGDTSGWFVGAEPLSDTVRGDLRPALLVLLGAVACVLLIACVNVANLLLARATARRKEIATRLAMGATRARLMSQLITESMILALIGGAVGVFLGYIGVNTLLALLPIQLPTFIHVTIDARVLVVALFTSIVTGLLFGIVPAWQTTSPRLADTLKDGRGAPNPAHHRLRDMLVVAEMGLAVILLVGAGLMVRSFVKYQQARFGFDPQNVLTFELSLPGEKYKEEARARAFFQQAEQRLSSLPGVESVGIGSSLPMEGGWTNTYTIAGKQINPDPHSFFAAATPDYFKALGIQIVRGRAFSPADGDGAPLVAIIDDKTARAYFGSEDPIGHQITFDNDKQNQPRWRTIVGMVASVRHNASMVDAGKGQVYLPHAQLPLTEMKFAVHTTGTPTAIANAARAQIRQIDSDQPVQRVSTMEQIMEDNLAQPRFNTVLLGIFGGLALVLAAIGIYGVLSYSVTQRTHEIGVRMALGAQQSTVVGMVMKHAMRLAALGMVIGVIIAFAATRALSSMLFRVSRTDPTTYIGIVAILGVVALLASYAPARRATKVDPMIALRSE